MDKADYVYNPKDWESTYPAGYEDEIYEELGVAEIMEVGQLKLLPSKWAVRLPVEIDENGDVLEDEVRWFDSEEEANAARDAFPSTFVKKENPDA